MKIVVVITVYHFFLYRGEISPAVAVVNIKNPSYLIKLAEYIVQTIIGLGSYP